MGDLNEVDALRERAKELRCIYQVNDIVSDRRQSPAEIFLRVLGILPAGWQRPATTGGRIEYLGHSYVGPGYSREGSSITAPLQLWKTEVGRLEVADCSPGNNNPVFLPEEKELLQSITRRLGEYLEWKHTQLMSERMPGATDHWIWRERYATAIAAALEPERFGVTRLFVGGSTELGQAGSGSDIDLYIEFSGTDEQHRDLTLWFEGWSCCLAELAFQQTGYRFSNDLLDLHWIDAKTDPRKLTSWRELPLRKRNEKH
ncbi:MAG: nucleotidyltransferase domain-containing protein [Planctomycetota bacterium]|nr:nucleotidyltransferase domain-containing protein [Planctomycetota bacterium]